MENNIYHIRWDGEIRLDLECPLINHHPEMIVYKEVEAEKGIHYHAAVELKEDKKTLNNIRQKIIYWLKTQLEERYPEYVAKRREGKSREPQWLSLKKCRPKGFINYISKEGECVRNSESLRNHIQELKDINKKQLKDKSQEIYVRLEQLHDEGTIRNYFDLCQALYYISKDMNGKPLTRRDKYITIAHSLGIIKDGELFRRLGIIRYDEDFNGEYEHKAQLEENPIETVAEGCIKYTKRKLKKRIVQCGKRVVNEIIKSNNIV